MSADLITKRMLCYSTRVSVENTPKKTPSQILRTFSKYLVIYWLKPLLKRPALIPMLFSSVYSYLCCNHPTRSCWVAIAGGRP